MYPYYLEAYTSGKLREVIEILNEQLSECRLCPRECGANRHEKAGICLQKAKPRLINYLLHFGEEPPLVYSEKKEKRGAGTVFFSGCSMKCIYCQNFGFSQLNNGRNFEIEELAEAFLELQEKGALNLDLVTPTSHLPFILEALSIAIEKGLRIPIVYNTSSYEKVEILKLLDGIVDIYLADIRYTDNETGKRYSGVDDYWSIAKKAILEMYRQVGPFKEEPFKRGLIIRHLVLPNGVGGSEKAFEFISGISLSIPISLMSQYFPVYKALNDPVIGRKITKAEYETAIELMEKYHLSNGWIQEFELN
ncbi:MAG: putative pyruvate formate lyase activating enzyme [Thermotogaceae bacterium]|jgi:putative pyruvate formate lyase activating enzyme|nr:putative pyruvate formate lyase activating enzyme [Thermotogaceae bacterium]